MEPIVFWSGCALLVLVLSWGALALVNGMQHARLAATERSYIEREWALRLARAEYEVQQVREQSLSWSGWRKFRVERCESENITGSIRSFYLVAHDRKPVPRHRPGQFIMVRVEVPIDDDPSRTRDEVRCYSLSDCARPDHFRISVRKITSPPSERPGVVSTYLHESVDSGDLIDVAAPTGDFYLDVTSDSSIVLIAGGVGVTPILSMLNQLVKQRTLRHVWVFYAVRTLEDAAFLGDFRKAADALPHCEVVICLSDERGPARTAAMPFKYHTGRVNADLLAEMLPALNNDYYICGPPPMMLGLRDELVSRGVRDRRIHFEMFSPEEPADSGADEAAPGEAHPVEFASSKVDATWNGEKSIFAMTRAQKLDSVRITYSCRQGKCGTCMTAVRSGSVAYPHTQPACPGLTEDYCLPCICVPDGPLVLEA